MRVNPSALQRSLWSDRDQSGYPDQGRIRLEAHPAGVPGYQNNFTAPPATTSIVATDLFPSHAAVAASDQLSEIDRRRTWVLRRTPDLEITPAGNIAALCLVVEGHHRHAYDTDAYFDDIRVHYQWHLPGSGV